MIQFVSSSTNRFSFFHNGTKSSESPWQMVQQQNVSIELYLSRKMAMLTQFERSLNRIQFHRYIFHQANIIRNMNGKCDAVIESGYLISLLF